MASAVTSTGTIANACGNGLSFATHTPTLLLLSLLVVRELQLTILLHATPQQFHNTVGRVSNASSRLNSNFKQYQYRNEQVFSYIRRDCATTNDNNRHLLLGIIDAPQQLLGNPFRLRITRQLHGIAQNMFTQINTK
jgi:hypothetical protein